MRDDLLEYYERELSFLRRGGAEFARRYPKIASRLQLEANKCDDPHVERLLEGFAFLAARVHLKVDDDFSEVSEALLNVIYPHYIRPVPSLSMVQFHLDPDAGKVTTGLPIPKGTALHSRPVRGVPCRFRTCYDTTLWPLTVRSAQWVSPHQLKPPVGATDAVAALRVQLDCLSDVRFDKLDLETLRIYLNGESNLVSTLYELLLNNCSGILVRDPERPSHPPIRWPRSALLPVGFEEREGLLPFPRRAFLAYRMLQEYFTFPEKYHFLDVSGFEALRDAGFGSSAELVFLISAFERTDRKQMLEAGVSEDTIGLGCTPIVNLFPQTSEPVRLTQRRYEHPIVADARRRLETSVLSVEEVVAVTPGSSETLRFEPFYSFRHQRDGDRDELFWYARRERSAWREDEGTDVLLSFVDLSGRPAYPDQDAVTCRLLCFNSDIPSQLPFGNPEGDFTLEDGGGPIQRIVTLLKPTRVIQPPLGKPQLWRLISQLSLNYLSLVGEDPKPLQELLRAYNLGESTSADRNIDGIVSVKSGPAYSRVESEYGLSFARGRRVEIELDEESFTGGGVYLFASVIERFLGLYASLNSFCMLVAKTKQRKEPLREWPPRAGLKPLI